MTEKEIDALVVRAEKSSKKMSRRALEAHYACALANWNIVIDERNKAQNATKALKKALRQAVVHSSKHATTEHCSWGPLMKCVVCGPVVKTGLRIRG